MSRFLPKFMVLVFISLFFVSAGQSQADNQKPLPNCSSQSANPDCILTIDRFFPITYSSIQMRRGSTLHVKLINAFPFEKVGFSLTSVAVGSPADQTQAFASAVFPSLKGVNFATWLTRQNELIAMDHSLVLPYITFTSSPNDPIKQFITDIKGLNQSLFKLYAQVGEVNSAISPECATNVTKLKSACERDPNIPNSSTSPRPWMTADFPAWRHLVMCEVSGAHCDEVDRSLISFSKLLSLVNTDLNILNTACNSGEYSALSGPTTGASKSSTLDTSVKCPSKTLVDDDADFDALQAYQTELTSVTKDLTNLLQNLLTYQGPQGESQLEWTVTRHGSDPYSVPQPVYALTVLNEVASTNLSSVASPKNMTTVTVFFYEPEFEVSTGALFSTVPNRTFANQTVVTQTAGVPVPGDVYIAKTVTRPAILPFVAANFRIGHDVSLLGGRRQAFYGTGLVAFNPYTSLLDYGLGVSYSWRSVTFTPIYHLAHDTRLTQNEFAGEIFCNQTAAHDSIPKCSGSPPAPSTEKYLTSAFGFGISIRPQSLFSSSK